MARGSRRGDWWVDTRMYGVAQDISPGNTVAIPIVDQITLFEYEDTCVLDRVVGHFFLNNLVVEDQPESFDASNFRVHLRIRPARELLSSLNQYSVSGTILDGDVAEEDFLWERKMWCDPVVDPSIDLNGNAGVDVPWYHTIDCRVSRRIDQGEAIILSVTNGPSTYAQNGGVRELRVTPYLRAYVLH